MPAYQRYSGRLYENGSSAIGRAVGRGFPVVIVSGGYGLVLAHENIGDYDKEFVRSNWPNGLLETCLLQHARILGTRTVIAVMARTSAYAKLIRNVGWQRAGIKAKIVAPVCPPLSGAQGKVPRAQGEVIANLVGEGLNNGWRSSDGLPLEIESL